MQEDIISAFGNRLRVRPCGLVLRHDSVLLLKHKAINEKGYFWSPPGGGLKFGESIEQCLKREFLEETNCEIEIKSFYKIYEYLKPPLHAIELFYECEITQGEPKMGLDPELGREQQIITEIRFIEFESVLKMDSDAIHPLVLEITKKLAQ